MKLLNRLFHDPRVRLAARAIAAAAVYAFSHLHGHRVDHTLLVTALVGAGWAALEVVTPLNGILGVFKTAEKADPTLAVLAPPADLPPTPSAAPPAA